MMDFEEFRQSCIVHKMREGETVTAFDCGDDDLNDFILTDAPLYRKEKLAVTYLVVGREDGRVIAYFSLVNDRISTADFDSRTLYNRFSRRFNNRKRLRSYPAAKIGRLAVAVDMKGEKIGSILLHFIKLYFTADNKTGCRFLTVDAYKAAVPFYQRNGFVPLNDGELDDATRLLYFDLNDLDED